MFQENNLDIEGRLIWVMAPTHEISKSKTPPFVIAESGKFFACSEFFSKREGGNGYLILYTQAGKGLLKYMGKDYELTSG